MYIFKKTTPVSSTKYTLVSLTHVCSLFVIVGFFFQLLQSSTSESQSSAEALKSVLHKKPLDMRESTSALV